MHIYETQGCSLIDHSMETCNHLTRAFTVRDQTSHIYHALTRIFTSPCCGSGMVFLVTLSLLRPPKPANITARISLGSMEDATFSASMTKFLSIICSVSSSAMSAESIVTFAMSVTEDPQVLSSPFLFRTGAQYMQSGVRSSC